jgi:O-antigen ligase
MTVAHALRARNLGAHADSAARWLCIGIGFAVPISVFLDSVLLVALLLAWLVGGQWQERWTVIRANPVAVAVLVLLALLAVGMSWGDASFMDSVSYLRKYQNLLLIPVAVTIMRNHEDRDRAMMAFTWAMLLILLLSFGLGLGLVPRLRLFVKDLGDPGNAVVFKQHITQTLMMSVAFALFVEHARARIGWRRLAWGLAALAAAADILLLVRGRTGYVTFAAIVVYLCIGALRWRGVAAGIGLLAFAFGLAYSVPGPFKHRIDMTIAEAHQWELGNRAGTSVGYRLDYYANTLEIIREHPLVGTGTGGFPEAYRRQVAIHGGSEIRNPHNQYLLITAQLGVLGLAALLFVFVQHWRHAGRLPRPHEVRLARATLLAVMSGCLFNSFLVDHAECVLYAWMTGVLFAGLGPPHPEGSSSREEGAGRAMTNDERRSHDE